MALSAEKLIMIGVGALGAFAVYKLVTAPKEQSPETGPSGSSVAPIPGPGGQGSSVQPTQPTTTTPTTSSPLPARPGPVDLSPAKFAFLATPISGPNVHLLNSHHVRGRLELPAAQATPTDANMELAQVILRSMGLEQDTIKVFATPEEAVANGIPPFAVANAGQGTRWFRALFLGATKDVRKPSQLLLMWDENPRPVIPPRSFVSGMPHPYVAGRVFPQMWGHPYARSW